MSGRSEGDIDDFWSVALMADSSCSRRQKFNNNGLDSDDEVQNDNKFSGIGNCCVNKSDFLEDENESDDEAVTARAFTVLPPRFNQYRNTSQPIFNEMNRKLQIPLNLKIAININDGIMSDVSGTPWDASFLLSGYLFGTDAGRRLCYDALFGMDDSSADNNRSRNKIDLENSSNAAFGGGILELGSGLGIVGLAAAAAALSFCPNQTVEIESNDEMNVQATNHSFVSGGGGAKRIVMTDLNDAKILSFLKKNVESNLEGILALTGSSTSVSSFSANGNAATVGSLQLLVEPCDWLDIAKAFSEKSNGYKSEVYKRHSKCIGNECCENFPRGQFNLILGSALVYMPDHAAACAETIYHYLKESDWGKGQTLKSFNRQRKSSDHFDRNHDDTRTRRFSSPQAIVLQFPDRAGFTSHFLPRCQELGLCVRCFELDGELIDNVELGLNRSILSAGEYRIYHISRKY